MDRPSDVLRAYFETFGHGGLEEAAAFWHDDIEWRPVGRETDDAGVIRGRDAMRRYYAEWDETMEDLHAEFEVAFEDDEVLAALVHNSGRGRASGVPAAGAYYVVCLVRDGRIVLGNEYASREEAIAAAEELSGR